MVRNGGSSHIVNYRVLSILLIGFGTLAAVTGFLWFSAARKAEQIYRDASTTQETYRQLESIAHQIRSDIFLSGINIRDLMLDRSTDQTRYRMEAQRIKASMYGHLDDLDSFSGSREKELVDRLRRQVGVYWALREPMFDWTFDQKTAFSRGFLRNEITSQRNTVISITAEMDSLRAASAAQEQLKTKATWADFRKSLAGMFSFALVFGCVVAAVSIIRIMRLERRSEYLRLRTEQAEEELRRLSQQLVQAQEEERKAISRELHDEIGQMLTALRIELGNLESLRTSTSGEFQSHLADSKALTENLLQSVRSLAMGLRPAMLDHLGLGPALQWQTREFSSRTQIQAAAETDPNLQELPEAVCICIYRVVQESLTNCARHSKASKVRVSVHRAADGVSLTVQDDGLGFDPVNGSSRGLGLIGMQERVKQLGGTMRISSEVRKGTRLEVRLPLYPDGLPATLQDGRDSTSSFSAGVRGRHEAPDAVQTGHV